MTACIIPLLILSLGIAAWSGILHKIAGLSLKQFKNIELLCMAILLTPISISFILWLLMLVFPGKISGTGYITIVPGCFLAAVLCFRHELTLLWKGLRREMRSLIRYQKIPPAAIWGFCIIICAGLLVTAFWAAINPIRNFDVVEYCLGGDMFARTRAVIYDGAVLDLQNGFLYRTYHSYALPLTGTFGNFLSSAFGVPQDWYFRFICLYYFGALNFMALVFLGLVKRHKNSILLVVCAFLALNINPVTFDFLFFYGCDFFRVSLLTAMVYLVWKYCGRPQWSICIFLGIFAAAVTAVHGMSVFFGAILLLPVFFTGIGWKEKLAHIALLGSLTVLLSGTHYILQTFYGDEWFFCLSTEVSSNALNHRDYLILFTDKADIIFNGYLGQLFSLRTFSVFGCFALILLWLCSCKIRAFILPHKVLLGCLVLIYICLSIRFYYNFRYQYTLFPLIIISTFGMLPVADIRPKSVHAIFAATLLGVLITSVFLSSNFLKFTEQQNRTRLLPPKQEMIRSNSLKQQRMQYGVPQSSVWDYLADKSGFIVFCGKNKLFYRDVMRPCYFYRNDAIESPEYFPCSAKELPGKFRFMVVEESYKNTRFYSELNLQDWLPVYRNKGATVYQSCKYKGDKL